MATGIKLRAKLKNGVTTVKALMKHPMETGARKDKESGKPIPAHFIQELKCQHNGKDLLLGHLSGGISKNPYLSFRFKNGNKGDAVTLAWTDNKGESESKEVKIK
ncbi:MAG: thiosulfate oxidation carrier complex protein SoxZ [Gammaproteobacteria bacterium]|nr:thiosulfate oxidation carrier complex protein SoxZ [Gammaproteobacteria bacterium]